MNQPNNKTQENNQDIFLPLSEALELFNPLDKNAFFYQVRKKKEIATMEGETERDTRYSKNDTARVRTHLLNKASKRKKQQEIEIDWLKPQDITAAMDLDYILYQEHFIGEAQLYQSWRYKNPYISMAAFDAKDRRTCLGYVGLIPLPENTILDILSEKRDELSILPEEIELYNRPGSYTLLANSVAVHPDKPELLYKLLYRMMQFWIDQYPERYIKKIYTQAVSEKGEIMVQHFFMAPRPDLAYNAFELDIARPSASRIIKWFKEQMIQKSELPLDIQYPPKRISGIK